MALCMGRLGMSSKDFWALTPKEACIIVKAFAGKLAGEAGAPSRQDLMDLIAQYDEG